MFAEIGTAGGPQRRARWTARGPRVGSCSRRKRHPRRAAPSSRLQSRPPMDEPERRIIQRLRLGALGPASALLLERCEILSDAVSRPTYSIATVPQWLPGTPKRPQPQTLEKTHQRDAPPSPAPASGAGRSRRHSG
jgi:hypothetical protein